MSTNTFVNECPNCKKKYLEIDFVRGEVYCKNCGIIIKDILFNSDINNINNKYTDHSYISKKKENVHMTYISSENKDYFEKRIPENDLPKLRRMRKWQKRYNDFRKNKNLMYVIHKIKNITEYLSLPKYINDLTYEFYTKIYNKHLIDKYGKNASIYASILLICRKNRIPITIKDISNYSGIDRKVIGRTYKIISKSYNHRIPFSNPRDFLLKFSSELGINSETLSEASDILKEIDGKHGISGKNPASITAATLYLASQKSGQIRTQSEIVKATGISESTIRRRYKDIIKILKNNKMERYYKIKLREL
jgi:transcription initiation factor TFIIB